MIIYIISDGKKGHLSQTKGLAEALIRHGRQLRPDAEHAYYEVSITGKTLLSKLFYKGLDLNLPRPHLILCAGHSTHLAALSLARHLRCLCMVCMKPSLPLCFFDLCIMPRHDLRARWEHNPRVFSTVGAINCIRPCPAVPKRETLVLIGGPSKEYEWDSETIINQLNAIIRNTGNHIVLTTSRRTPKDFAADVEAKCSSVRVVPVEETGPDWVAEHLACAKEVWVTQDSVSMVYESLSSGAPVGVLEMPRRMRRGKPVSSKVYRGLKMLIDEGGVSTVAEWSRTHTLQPPAKVLNEADRAAEYILSHFPSLTS